MGVGVGVSVGMGVGLGVGMGVGMGADVGPSYKKMNYSNLGFSLRTHPIMRLAVESHSEAAFVVWCCTHK